MPTKSTIPYAKDLRQGQTIWYVSSCNGETCDPVAYQVRSRIKLTVYPSNHFDLEDFEYRHFDFAKPNILIEGGLYIDSTSSRDMGIMNNPGERPYNNHKAFYSRRKAIKYANDMRLLDAGKVEGTGSDLDWDKDLDWDGLGQRTWTN